MTEMKRITVAIPETMNNEIMEIRKNDMFIRCTYSELVRKILECGMKKIRQEQADTDEIPANDNQPA